METRATRIALGIWTALVILFLLFPIGLIAVYAFNASDLQGWPITQFSTRRFGTVWHNQDVRGALWLSVRAGLLATGWVLEEFVALDLDFCDGAKDRLGVLALDQVLEAEKLADVAVDPVAEVLFVG